MIYDGWHAFVARLRGLPVPPAKPIKLVGTLVTDHGVEIPVENPHWTPFAIHHVLEDIDALPELQPRSFKV